jgi:PhnB protein
MQVQVYLFFAGRCEEAIHFYKKTLGAEVMMLMRFKDSPDPPQPDMIPSGSEDSHAHLPAHRRYDGDGLQRPM